MVIEVLGGDFFGVVIIVEYIFGAVINFFVRIAVFFGGDGWWSFLVVS